MHQVPDRPQAGEVAMIGALGSREIVNCIDDRLGDRGILLPGALPRARRRGDELGSEVDDIIGSEALKSTLRLAQQELSPFLSANGDEQKAVLPSLDASFFGRGID